MVEMKERYFSFSGTALGFAAAHGLSPSDREAQIRGRGRPSYFYFFSWGASPPNPPGLAALEKGHLWHYHTIPERPKGPPPRQWPPEGQRSVTNALFTIIEKSEVRFGATASLDRGSGRMCIRIGRDDRTISNRRVRRLQERSADLNYDRLDESMGARTFGDWGRPIGD
ncbi:uncharacterized protein K444DRAFT_388453 [Hyaloscypha bicolor E]|uniref:Uncharacterized protein n=1 Tax=Hyaloscypha bicolor E TaxID=1095630 RepID=A0A2J6TCL3_9HELO|nr:uncharacterized protein K444DRAFT_388453 [Hyaloscypha bicolor E]PMD60756.1 hypothetical protein K444DRAFT_388453 [Hyaloscypha bicolor E]